MYYILVNPTVESCDIVLLKKKVKEVAELCDFKVLTVLNHEQFLQYVDYVTDLNSFIGEINEN